MCLIQINELPIKVVRSPRRKTIAIKIQNGDVSLHIPKLVPLWLAKQFVIRKQQWIHTKLQNYQQRPPARQFVQDEPQLFRGVCYPLTVDYQPERQRTLLKFDQQGFKIFLPLQAGEPEIRQAFARWYRRQAESVLTERVKQLASETGLQPKKIQIKSYKSRWGSCNARGDIQLNWQLIQAAPDIQDYVIIHELCHLQHLNHSTKFWELVEQFDAQYRCHRAWLKAHGHQLAL